MKIASPDGGKETRPRPVNSKLLSGAGDTMVAPWGGNIVVRMTKTKLMFAYPHTLCQERDYLCVHIALLPGSL